MFIPENYRFRFYTHTGPFNHQFWLFILFCFVQLDINLFSPQTYTLFKIVEVTYSTKYSFALEYCELGISTILNLYGSLSLHHDDIYLLYLPIIQLDLAYIPSLSQ